MNYGTANAYTYNNKEWIGNLDLRWYDYGARMMDSPAARWWVMDRYAENYFDLTPYQYGANNPGTYIDVNGDALKLSGTINELVQVLYGISKICNCSVTTSDIEGSDDNYSTYVTEVKTNDKGGPSSGIIKDLSDVVNSSETYHIKVKYNNPREVDEIEQYGGAMFVGEEKTMYFTDQWFTDQWSKTGGLRPRYRYKIAEPGPGDWLAYNTTWGSWKFDYAKTGSRVIPLSETIGHELHHAARHTRGIRVYNERDRPKEENAAINHMNKYRTQLGIPLRGRFHEPQC